MKKPYILLVLSVCLLASCSRCYMQRIDGHWAVDLGTDVLWATQNIRAPQYIAWSDDTMWQGERWHRPSNEDFEALIETCQWTWVSKGKQHGYRITGRNGASIFLPADGYIFRNEKEIDSRNEYGGYWSSDLEDSTGEQALYLMFGDSFYEISANPLYYLRTIRPVCHKIAQQPVTHHRRLVNQRK